MGGEGKKNRVRNKVKSGGKKETVWRHFRECFTWSYVVVVCGDYVALVVVCVFF